MVFSSICTTFALVMTTNGISDRRLPAEWEPQSGIQLTWPHEHTDWAPMLDEITTTYIEMAREIACREHLLVVMPSEEYVVRYRDAIGHTDNVTFAIMPSNDTWARDHAFISTDSYLLDFCFNGWGEKFPAELDNAINRRLFDAGVIRGRYESHLDFVLEGGSIESDGRGTVLTTTNCLMALHRNQPLTKAEIEHRLKTTLGAKRILWIDHGCLVGDDTDGHIDTIVRTAPDNTLLYIGCSDSADEQYAELQLMEQQLFTLRTSDNEPYRLLRLPTPSAIFDNDGCRLPATYANFLVINGAVLCPTYAQPTADAEALRIIGEAFPGREIIGIDCRSIIKQHGSLHCCTMQYFNTPFYETTENRISSAAQHC